LTNFQITRQGIPIVEYPIKHKLETGITLDNVTYGLVSEYEELETMRFTNHSLPEWESLSSQTQAKLVAFHRIEKLVKLNQSDAQQIDAERKAKKRK